MFRLFTEPSEKIMILVLAGSLNKAIERFNEKAKEAGWGQVLLGVDGFETRKPNGKVVPVTLKIDPVRTERPVDSG